MYRHVKTCEKHFLLRCLSSPLNSVRTVWSGGGGGPNLSREHKGWVNRSSESMALECEERLKTDKLYTLVGWILVLVNVETTKKVYVEDSPSRTMKIDALCEHFWWVEVKHTIGSPQILTKKGLCIFKCGEWKLDYHNSETITFCPDLKSYNTFSQCYKYAFIII